MTTIHIASLNELHEAARRFISLMDGNSVFAFYGNMGAGKTTFIKALCEELGVTDDVINSPTFAIVNEYRTRKGRTIYHFDCYRIARLREALDMGCEDYFDSGELCLIEWPENIEPLLPGNCVDVHITVGDDESRTVTIQ